MYKTILPHVWNTNNVEQIENLPYMGMCSMCACLVKHVLKNIQKFWLGLPKKMPFQPE